MRPILKLTMALLALALLALGYFANKELDTFDKAVAAKKIQHEAEFARTIRDACLSYAVEYNRLPPDSNNQRLTAALTGDNTRHVAFLSLSKNQLNANGEMIDRWGTPLKINFQGTSGIQVASAGPDKVFGTFDDIVSNSLIRNENPSTH